MRGALCSPVAQLGSSLWLVVAVVVPEFDDVTDSISTSTSISCCHWHGSLTDLDPLLQPHHKEPYFKSSSFSSPIYLTILQSPDAILPFPVYSHLHLLQHHPRETYALPPRCFSSDPSAIFHVRHSLPGRSLQFFCFQIFRYVLSR